MCNVFLQDLDVDGSGSLSYAELCSRLRLLKLKPPIHLTLSDFDIITQVLNCYVSKSVRSISATRTLERARKKRSRLYHIPGNNAKVEWKQLCLNSVWP